MPHLVTTNTIEAKTRQQASNHMRRKLLAVKRRIDTALHLLDHDQAKDELGHFTPIVNELHPAGDFIREALLEAEAMHAEDYIAADIYEIQVGIERYRVDMQNEGWHVFKWVGFWAIFRGPFEDPTAARKWLDDTVAATQ